MSGRLTQRTSGAGCAVKYPPGALDGLLAKSGIAGGMNWTGDDAAVLNLGVPGQIVHTVDLVTPMVDDPYTWGKIAAVHAMSDVYAMGARPVSSLSILGWPRDLTSDMAGDVLRGGLDACVAEACQLLGGHTYFDEEPKYGLAVIGELGQSSAMTMDKGRPGDLLFLTKPIGVGVMTTYHAATGEDIVLAVQSMLASNRIASQEAVELGIMCATDVSGYGLLGAALQIAARSNVTVRIDAACVPILDGSDKLAASGFVSGGTMRNLEWVTKYTRWDGVEREDLRLLLADAQTSGGLLLASRSKVNGWLIGALSRRQDVPLVVC